jgi:hypothetical protein
MLQFLMSTLSIAFSTSWFLEWSLAHSETQLDKMQQKVHFTPGSETLVPPVVALSSVGLLSSHLVIGRLLLRLRGWQMVLSLLVGALAGVGIFVFRRNEQPS